MSKIILIDGNSILNRAFYGIMGSKMLMTKDGVYTNAVYGFLAILFKELEDLKPEYIAVAFDLKAPTMRHKLYEGYKATRKGMPEELAMQMPIIKKVLTAMNIKIIEKEGFEADDVLGTMSKRAESKGFDVVILSGDRDNFQLVSDKVTVRIPRTKAGKTEEDDFNPEKILETYGLNPIDLIQVKGLMGDTSDNIPGVPGVGEKTALSIVKEYKTIDDLYKAIDEGTDSLKGKLKENIVVNKDLAILSRTLGTIERNVPLEVELEDCILKEWDKENVLELFEELRFNRFIERFDLKKEESKEELFDFDTIRLAENNVDSVIKEIKDAKKLIYHFGIIDDFSIENIIKKKINLISFYDKDEKNIYYLEGTQNIIKYFKEVFEDKDIKKIGNKQKLDYILLKQVGIETDGFDYDIEIAAYILNPTNTKFDIENLSKEYLNIDVENYVVGQDENVDSQMNLFAEETEDKKEKSNSLNNALVFCIKKLYEMTYEKLKETEQEKLFKNIEMPLVKVLAQMQYDGIYVDKQELIEYGKILKIRIEELKKEIYEIAGEEFNINSTKQLGELLFVKLQLPSYKKTKSGFSTDVDVLEKLRNEHPIIEKILEYRQLMKLNSTYVEGLLPYINEKTGRIHSYFHQTVTATGRISSTEPNLQNIPTRIELGKKLRKVFKPKENCVFLDADYSQIELRVLAHISNDSNMIQAFNNDEDIHAQAASKVFNLKLEEVTKEKRAQAKAVNFGIVYGISDFGLAEQLGISRKLAKTYIEQYLEKYAGIDNFMKTVIDETKEKGYAETLFKRRRYVPELNSSNYMVRQFGGRVAMNTPIQGTAADIIKIAMINVEEKLRKDNLKAKILLQIHDELLLEVPKEELEKVKVLLKNEMENAIKLNVPIIVDMSTADNWYEAK